MKKSILVTILAMLLFSCSSDESKMKESITNKIKEHLKNPDSFEFVSMEIKSKISLDTVAKRVNLKNINEFRQLITESDTDENKDFLNK